MSYRTVCIKNRGKLSYSLNYLIFKSEEEVKIHLSEITTLIIQNTACVITSSLLSELIDRKIKVIFCDEKHNPISELVPYYGSHDTSIKIKNQISWLKDTKNLIWKIIVKQKIYWQSRVLKKYKFVEASNLLMSYREEVLDSDITNREGHAAKVYFNRLFGNSFSRSQPIQVNTYLNYGYSIILSAFNRTIVSLGYLTQLGIHHHNEYNQFNLACDLMEPFRPIVDDYACSGMLSEETFKTILANLLNIKIIINNKEMYLDNAITLYVQRIFHCLNNNDFDKIVFYKDYEL